MTEHLKDELNKEILKKVKEGIKPSQLKRSKSADDLLKQSNNSNSLTKCEQELNQTKKDLALAHSQLEPLAKLVEKQDCQIQALTEQISRIKEETDKQLKPVAELKEELKVKDQELAELRNQLDKSLEQRLANLKEPTNQAESNQLVQELNQAKRKISLLESTLRLKNYNNS
jgi:archaellum component FlaC